MASHVPSGPKHTPSVVVIGGGPAGLMAAGRAAELGAHVLLIERNQRLAVKLRITGKGRCNLTNTAPTDRFIEAFSPNGRFLYGPLSRFSPEDLRTMLGRLGVPTVEERGGRVFPATGSASDVADALERWARHNGVRVVRNCRARSLAVQQGAVVGVVTEGAGTVEADRIVVATGGLSYPRTGSTGDGYELARQVGHTVVPCRPALVPLETAEEWPKTLQGVALRNVRATLFVDGRASASEFGEMLFTHFGLSGPIILTLSRSIVPVLGKARVEVSLDLKPALSPERLDARLVREFHSKRMFRNYLPELSVRALGPVLAAHSGIPEHQPLNGITSSQRRRLVAVVKDLRMTIARARPIEEAIVTAGGVCLKEIDPRSMQSKLVQGLYFAGEVLDLDAVTGGFNLQAAFTTGWVAGDSAGTG